MASSSSSSTMSHEDWTEIDAGFARSSDGITLAQALNGAGATKLPLFLDLTCFLILQVPVAYYMGTNHERLGFDRTHLWWTLNGVIALSALLYAAFWWHGAWKEKEVQ